MNDIGSFESNLSTYVRAISLPLTRSLRWWTATQSGSDLFQWTSQMRQCSLLVQDLHPVSWQVTTLQQKCPICEFIALIYMHGSIRDTFNMHYNLNLLRSSCIIWSILQNQINSEQEAKSEQVEILFTQQLTWLQNVCRCKFSAPFSFVLPLLHSPRYILRLPVSEPSK